jgi:DNA polymerase I
MENCLIIDGHNLLFRMFYGIPGSIKSSQGTEIKAVVGFVSGLIKYINKFLPDNIIIVFDSETSIIDKSSDYKDYKSNRINYLDVPDNENPFLQLPHIFQVLDYLSIPYKEVQEYEADDYIASLCERFREQCKIIIVSTDQDFFQLVDDSISVFNPNGKDGTMFDSQKIYEKLGVYPNQIVDYKSLVGDNSDNISGIRGVGPKTAQKILSIGNINELIKDDLLDRKIYGLLKENEATINRNKKLITMKRDIPIDIEIRKAIQETIANLKAIDIMRSSGVY